MSCLAGRNVGPVGRGVYEHAYNRRGLLERQAVSHVALCAITLRVRGLTVALPVFSLFFVRAYMYHGCGLSQCWPGAQVTTEMHQLAYFIMEQGF